MPSRSLSDVLARPTLGLITISFRKVFRIDPAVSQKIYDFLSANDMLFREEPKPSKNKAINDNGDSEDPTLSTMSETPGATTS
jgi:hypothetical protein